MSDSAIGFVVGTIASVFVVAVMNIDGGVGAAGILQFAALVFVVVSLITRGVVRVVRGRRETSLDDRSPLEKAILLRDTKTLGALLTDDVDVDKKNEEGISARDYAHAVGGEIWDMIKDRPTRQQDESSK